MRGHLITSHLLRVKDVRALIKGLLTTPQTFLCVFFPWQLRHRFVMFPLRHLRPPTVPFTSSDVARKFLFIFRSQDKSPCPCHIFHLKIEQLNSNLNHPDLSARSPVRLIKSGFTYDNICPETTGVGIKHVLIIFLSWRITGERRDKIRQWGSKNFQARIGGLQEEGRGSIESGSRVIDADVLPDNNAYTYDVPRSGSGCDKNVEIGK